MNVGTRRCFVMSTRIQSPKTKTQQRTLPNNLRSTYDGVHFRQFGVRHCYCWPNLVSDRGSWSLCWRMSKWRSRQSLPSLVFSSLVVAKFTCEDSNGATLLRWYRIFCDDNPSAIFRMRLSMGGILGRVKGKGRARLAVPFPLPGTQLVGQSQAFLPAHL